MTKIIDLLNLDDNKNKSICIVRLTTNYWDDKKGLYLKKSVTILKRKCNGYNIIQEDTDNMGADEVVSRIVNLYSIEDGIYQVVICNESRDWETNNVEDYDYKLIPFK